MLRFLQPPLPPAPTRRVPCRASPPRGSPGSAAALSARPAKRQDRPVENDLKSEIPSCLGHPDWLSLKKNEKTVIFAPDGDDRSSQPTRTVAAPVTGYAVLSASRSLDSAHGLNWTWLAISAALTRFNYTSVVAFQSSSGALQWFWILAVGVSKKTIKKEHLCQSSSYFKKKHVAILGSKGSTAVREKSHHRELQETWGATIF